MRTVRHKSDSGHVLFRYPYFESLNDCDERIICMSERSMAIILNALDYADKMRTRVYSSSIEDVYTLVGDAEWSDFQYWVSTVRTELGSYHMCNEYLERIAEANERTATALESLDNKAQTFVTWQEILDDMATTLGVAHPFYLLIKAFTDLIPSIKNVKLDPWPMVAAMWKTRTFEGPLLAAMVGINTSLGTLAAAAVGEAIANKARLLIEAFGTLNDYYDKVRAALVGDFNLLDFINDLWQWFISDGEGGEGGEDPDNDPEIRTTVNVATSITLKALLTCDSCGGNGHSCSCGGGIDTGGDVTDFVDVPNIEEPDREGDPPTGYPSWEDYDEDKCRRIKHFLDNYISTLRNIGGLFGMVGGLTIAVIAGLLLITVPPAGIAFVLSALALLVIIDIGLLVHFTGIADYLEEHIDTLVCAMEERDTTAGMIEEINSMVNTAIGTLGLFDPEIEGNLEAAAEGLLSNAGLAYILESQSVPEGYESYTCPCGSPCGFQLYDPFSVGDNGGDVTIDGNHVTILPSFQAGRWAVAFQFSTAEVPNACARIDNIVITNANHVFYNDNWIECGSEAGFVELEEGDFTILENECIHAILFQADPNDNPNPGTQPTIEFDIIECCEP